MRVSFLTKKRSPFIIKLKPSAVWRLRVEAECVHAEAECLHAEAEGLRAEAEGLRAEAECLRAEAECLRAEAEGDVSKVFKHIFTSINKLVNICINDN